MTDRQFQAWQEWLQEDMNRPGKTEFYLAQIASEVHWVLASDRRGYDVNKFKMEFSRPGESKGPPPNSRPMTEQEQALVLMMSLGMPACKVQGGEKLIESVNRESQ